MTLMQKMKEMQMTELEGVSGGCVFSCSGQSVCYDEIREADGKIHKYRMNRCKDCGKEWYTRDDKNIAASTFFKNVFGCNV